MLQTMSDMPITRQPSRTVPSIRSQWCSFTKVAQCCQSNTTCERLSGGSFRVIVRRGGHVKRRIRLKEFDICLICTERAQDIDISNFKDSLAAVFNIFFHRIDSPVIRMQADELFWGFFCSPPFYWWMPLTRAVTIDARFDQPSLEIQSLKYDW